LLGLIATFAAMLAMLVGLSGQGQRHQGERQQRRGK